MQTPEARSYTVSEKAIQQRQMNASSRQFNGFMQTLQGKLRLHSDAVARLQEIAMLMRQSLSFETVVELYPVEFAACVQVEVAYARAELKAQFNEKVGRANAKAEELLQGCASQVAMLETKIRMYKAQLAHRGDIPTPAAPP